MLSHKVGNGENTFLWYDNWHTLGPLVERFGDRVMYDAALPMDSKVAKVISNNSWAWPVANSVALMAIKEKLTQLPSPSACPDRVCWDPSPNGSFSTSHTWKAIYGSHNNVNWYKLIWFKGAYPRYSFLMWLAVQYRLSTHDRIYTFTPGPLACTLCNKEMEDHNHLFFNCTYSTFIWQDILRRMNLQNNAATWEEVVKWAADKWKKKTPTHTIPKMALGAAVYHIWRERNASTFKNEIQPKEKILKNICTYMRAHISIAWKSDANLPIYIAMWD